MTKIAHEIEEEMWALSSSMDEKSLKTLASNGIRIGEVNDRFRKELDAIGLKLRNTWLVKGGSEAREVLRQYKASTGREF